MSAPHLMGPHDRQRLDPVGPTREVVVAVRGPRAAAGRRAVQTQGGHDAADALGVDSPTFAAEHGSQAAVAVGGPLAGQARQGLPQRGVLFTGVAGRSVQLAPWEVEQAADEPRRRVLGQAHDDLPPALAGPCMSREAFFKISNSRAWRPTNCSRSVMRWRSWRRCSSAWKTRGRRSRKVSLHRTSTEALSWCRRHSSAWDFSPRSRSRTTWALNSGVKLRRARRGMIQRLPPGPVLHIVLVSLEGRTAGIHSMDIDSLLHLGCVQSAEFGFLFFLVLGEYSVEGERWRERTKHAAWNKAIFETFDTENTARNHGVTHHWSILQ